MSDEPIGREALRKAAGDTLPDAARLVAAVPALMQEAERRRRAGTAAAPTLAQLSAWAMPRLAAVTAIGVIAATSYVTWERSKPVASPPPTIESVILGGEGNDTGDVVFDALLGAGRSDG
jgi:uncharacterized membrane protein YebE (DUF533 family)